MSWNWSKPAAMGMAILLLALVVSPVACVTLATALILTPVFLFSLIAIPRSLWPSVEQEPHFAAPVLARAGLFQRPPPFSIL